MVGLWLSSPSKSHWTFLTHFRLAMLVGSRCAILLLYCSVTYRVLSLRVASCRTLSCRTLCCTALCRVVPYCVAPHYVVLYRSVLCRSASLRVVLRGGSLQRQQSLLGNRQRTDAHSSPTADHLGESHRPHHSQTHSGGWLRLLVGTIGKETRLNRSGSWWYGYDFGGAGREK